MCRQREWATPAATQALRAHALHVKGVACASPTCCRAQLCAMNGSAEPVALLSTHLLTSLHRRAQLVARPFDEPRLFRIAFAYEQLTRLRRWGRAVCLVPTSYARVGLTACQQTRTIRRLLQLALLTWLSVTVCFMTVFSVQGWVS